jgi:hypothetical protein
LPGDRIILACKVSNVQDLIAVYTRTRAADHPLHLGLTEAGMGSKASSRRPRRSRYCCNRASATRSGFRSRPSRTATGRAKSWSRGRFCRRWVSVRLRRS